MANYFAVDPERKIIVNENGDEFTVEQFKKILDNAAEQDKGVDMTLMTQRFVRCNFDFGELERQYAEM